MNLAMRKTLITIIGFLLFAGLILLLAYYKDYRLMKNFGTDRAIITGLGNSRNSGGRIFLKYKFVLKNRVYHGNTSFSCNRSAEKEVANYMIGKEVVVVYQSTKPTNSEILLNKTDFPKYRFQPTKADSLALSTLCSLCRKKEKCDW